MVDSRLRVVVVGLGYFSQFHLRAWQRLDEVKLIGIADRDNTKVASAVVEFNAPGFNDLEAMLVAASPNIVDIVTPPSTHAAFIRAALAPDRVIVCQKPFCRDLAEAEAVVAEAEAAGTTLVVHENFRFQPWYRETKRLLDSDLLGPVYQCRFALRPGDGRGPGAYLARQPSFQSMPRFLVRETAVHLIDVFRWLFGEMSSVYADLRQHNPAIAGEDAGILLFRHKSGVTSLFDGNRLADHVTANRRKTMGEMVVEGEGGALRLDGDGRLYFRGFLEADEVERVFDYEDRDFGGGCVEALIRHVVDHINRGTPLENRARDYLRVVAFCEAAYRSAETGSAVTV